VSPEELLCFVHWDHQIRTAGSGRLPSVFSRQLSQSSLGLSQCSTVSTNYLVVKHSSSKGGGEISTGSYVYQT
jgi:hypothetical protein